MSVYSVKGKGYRYDFTLKGKRYTAAWFKTKSEAKRAEAKKREEVLNPPQTAEMVKEATPTDMAFLELVNRRMDYVKAYFSGKHYRDLIYYAKRWVRRWGKFTCSKITLAMVERFIIERRQVSEYTANKELRPLRATFNFAKKKGLFSGNPTEGVDFFPEDEKVKYIPPPEDIDKIIALADPETQDYLTAIRDTMARVNEINNLTWNDIDFEERYVVLFTRKKRGGHRAARKVPMTQRLYDILRRRFAERLEDKPWVFWHTYINRKTDEKVEGPYKDRRKIMHTLCRKAGVKYFRYHPLRHAGASTLDRNRVPVGTIQKILGHEDRKTTELYLHSMGEDTRVAMAIFEQVSQKSHTDSHTER
jgi:integrase